MPSVTKTFLSVCRQGHLNDYVTAIAWSPNHALAIASAAGEILLINPETQEEHCLQSANGQSIDCLDFSALRKAGAGARLLSMYMRFPRYLMATGIKR